MVFNAECNGGTRLLEIAGMAKRERIYLLQRLAQEALHLLAKGHTVR